MRFVKENLFETLFLLGAFFVVVMSIPLSIIDSEGNWFCRSGSIMVLFSVIAGFRLGVLQQKENSSASIAAGLGIPMPSDLSASKQSLGKIANGFSILGTLIWGYGDMFFNGLSRFLSCFLA